MEPQRHPRKCSATKRDGEPCGRWAIEGGTVCPTHGGSTAHVRQKAAGRKTANAVRKALGEIPDEPVDPAQALLGLVSAKQAEIWWLRSRVITIGDQDPTTDDAGEDALVWGRARHEQGIGPQGPIDKTDYTSEANIWWRLLREAEDQLAKYSTAALRAGVERRQLELQEAQAVHLATAINRILDALELTAEQARRAPEIVTTTLRSLPVEAQNNH